MANLPAVIHRDLIAATESHSLDVPRNGPLVAIDACRAILDTVALGQPATQDQASRLAEILIASYPKSDTESPEVYARGIISILAEHAPDIGKEAVDALTRERYTLPTRADINRACHATASGRLMARSIAKRHLAEYERRASEDAHRQAAADSWGGDRARKVAEIVKGHDMKEPTDG